MLDITEKTVCVKINEAKSGLDKDLNTITPLANINP